MHACTQEVYMWFHYDNYDKKESRLYLNTSQEKADKKLVEENPDWRGDSIYAYKGDAGEPNGEMIYNNDFPWDNYPEEIEGEVETDETSEEGKEVTDKEPEGTKEIDEGCAKFVIISEKFFRQEFHLGKEIFTIGREIGNDIVIEDDSISKAHVIIYQQDSSFTIEDQESLTGIDVNGVRITAPTTIKHGDIIRIGAIHFQFVEKAQAYVIKQWSAIEEEVEETDKSAP